MTRPDEIGQDKTRREGWVSLTTHHFRSRHGRGARNLVGRLAPRHLTTMNKIEEFVCDCTECVAMCRKFPCRPLPEEVDEMPPEVRARLMIQREGDCLSGVPHLAAGAVGFEGEGAPDFEVFFGSIGKPHTCTFLTDGLCELHGKCKPFEGRTAHHAQKHSTYGVLRDAWDTEEGAATLARWEREAAS